MSEMSLSAAGLMIQFLLVMSEFTWHKLVGLYVKEEITSVDDVLDPDPFGPRSRVSRDLGRGREGRANKEKCYPPYGCFSIDFPWTSEQRPEAFFPEPPEEIRPAFCLYTRQNPTECHVRRLSFPPMQSPKRFLLIDFELPQRLRTNETQRLRESPFDPRHPVTLLTHGYLEHGRKRWLLVPPLSASTLSALPHGAHGVPNLERCDAETDGGAAEGEGAERGRAELARGIRTAL
ncbi:unnamed protein product [Darwinula stevensoni]|uniref:Uncharacterized protein n=1 Tax=Darwinula stevensoni TaxID=69355 RepID=A0A7R8XK10_9CRUS|nr:unnamed protein product [Darwinula stevensoni]CAG0895854.1 unnamed protein product [Darwinula stevensoni]